MKVPRPSVKVPPPIRGLLKAQFCVAKLRKNELTEHMRTTAGTVSPASPELSPVFSNNNLLSVRCHTATASLRDKICEFQVVPFFLESWMHVSTDLSADRSLLCDLHCRFCCIAVVRVGKGAPTARKPSVTMVKSCLPVICYLPLVQAQLFQTWNWAVYCKWLGKDPMLLSLPCYWGCCLSLVLLLVFSWSLLKSTLALNC